MVKILSNAFIRIGGVIFVVSFIFSLILSVAVVNKAVGLWGVVVSFIFLPIIFVAAPLSALFDYVTWNLLIIVVFGGASIGGLLIGLGTTIRGNKIFFLINIAVLGIFIFLFVRLIEPPLVLKMNSGEYSWSRLLGSG